MLSGRTKVTLDLFFEIDEEEFRAESGMEKGETINDEYLRDGIREEIENLIRDNSGSSISLSMGEDNTVVRIISRDQT